MNYNRLGQLLPINSIKFSTIKLNDEIIKTGTIAIIVTIILQLGAYICSTCNNYIIIN